MSGRALSKLSTFEPSTFELCSTLPRASDHLGFVETVSGWISFSQETSFVFDLGAVQLRKNACVIGLLVMTS